MAPSEKSSDPVQAGDAAPSMYISWKVGAVYLVLLLIATPWYWGLLPESIPVIIVAGVPLWAFTAIVASFGLSVFTAILLMRAWPDEDASP